MENEAIVVHVDIFGSQYKLKGHSSVEYMKKVAASIDESMQKLAKSYPVLDTHKLAVLAAVQITEEIFRVRRENSRLQAEEARLLITEKQLQLEQERIEQLLAQYEQYKVQAGEELTVLKQLHAQQLVEQQTVSDEQQSQLKVAFAQEQEQVQLAHLTELESIIATSEAVKLELEQNVTALQEEHHKQIQELTENAVLEQKLALLQQKGRFETELAKLKVDAEKLIAENTQLAVEKENAATSFNDKLAAAEKLLMDSSQQASAVKAQLEGELESLRIEFERRNVELQTGWDQDKQQLSEQLSELQATSKLEKEGFELRLAQADEQILLAMEQEEVLRSELDQAERARVNIEDAKQLLAQQLLSEQELAQMEKASLARELAETQQTLETVVASEKAQVQQLQNEVASLEKYLTSSHNQTEDYKRRTEQLEEQKLALHSNIEQLNEQLLEEGLKQLAQEEQIEGIVAERDQLAAELEVSSTQSTLLTAQLEATTAELAQLNTRIEQLHGEQEQLKQQNIEQVNEQELTLVLIQELEEDLANRKAAHTDEQEHRRLLEQELSSMKAASSEELAYRNELEQELANVKAASSEELAYRNELEQELANVKAASSEELAYRNKLEQELANVKSASSEELAYRNELEQELANVKAASSEELAYRNKLEQELANVKAASSEELAYRNELEQELANVKVASSEELAYRNELEQELSYMQAASNEEAARRSELEQELWSVKAAGAEEAALLQPKVNQLEQELEALELNYNHVSKLYADLEILHQQDAEKSEQLLQYLEVAATKERLATNKMSITEENIKELEIQLSDQSEAERQLRQQLAKLESELLDLQQQTEQFQQQAMQYEQQLELQEVAAASMIENQSLEQVELVEQKLEQLTGVHEKLKREYSKLQTEYNEWIELIEQS